MDINSGRYLNFHFAGYIEKSEKKDYEDVIRLKQKISQKNIYFSESLFFKMRKELEKDTKWKHSGGVDFLLVDVVRKSSVELDFSNCIQAELSFAREKNTLPTLSIFFESIFKYAEENGGRVGDFSDSKVPTLAKDIFLKILNKNLFSLFEKGKIYAVRNLSRD